MSRGRRVFLGSAGLLLGLVLLGFGLWAVASAGGLNDSGLVPWAWSVVALLGLGFIHLQVMGAAAMVSLVIDEETARKRHSSASPENEEQ